MLGGFDEADNLEPRKHPHLRGRHRPAKRIALQLLPSCTRSGAAGGFVDGQSRLREAIRQVHHQKERAYADEQRQPSPVVLHDNHWKSRAILAPRSIGRVV